MKTKKPREMMASGIADAIVEFVECVGGPVTLARIEREIPGFAEHNDRAPAWCYECEGGEGEGDTLMWDGMTEEGCAALRGVLARRRVAIKPAPRLVYLLEGRFPLSQNWVPIALVPARMANLEMPGLLVRASQHYLDQIMARTKAEQVDGFRLLGPCS